MALPMPRAAGFGSLVKEGARYYCGLNDTLFKNIVGPNELRDTLKSAYHVSRRFATFLAPSKITQLLAANEINLDRGQDSTLIPSQIKTIQCNQLAANDPIEDRLRVSALRLPGSREPTLMLGVFDGHGGGTTANLISRRLFNYIAISAGGETSNNSIVDLHNLPQPSSNSYLESNELDMLNRYKKEQIPRPIDIAASLLTSFRRCDDDLSQEIQDNLMQPANLDNQALRHYLSASVSGCCAIVMVIHEGTAYLASSGDCRAVLGVYSGEHEVAAATSSWSHFDDKRGRFAPVQDQRAPPSSQISEPNSTRQYECPRISELRAVELNDEHNCDNINEIRRLSAAHPRSEQNTMIKHNRLLGHLMPFRAFGDFTYKWPAELIRACGITRAFGPGVIPASYESPPYLIVEPDVRVLPLEGNCSIGGAPRGNDQRQQQLEQTIGGASSSDNASQRYLVMASDGLWELFESSRDVIETIVDHSLNSQVPGLEEDYDRNCATYVLRSALRSGPHQDIGMDRERVRKLNHVRLESTLTLPKSIVRNYRDDISLILMKLDV